MKFKPYILSRFASWGHAWEAASTTGYQQTRTMSAAASGGLLGMGAGNGWLHNVAAADTDLVFGMLCEEWGLLIAVLAVGAIITLAFFAARACREMCIRDSAYRRILTDCVARGGTVEYLLAQPGTAYMKDAAEIEGRGADSISEEVGETLKLLEAIRRDAAEKAGKQKAEPGRVLVRYRCV